MNISIEELPVDERLERVRHHILCINMILWNEAEIDTDWYQMLMTDLEVLSDLIHTKDGYREFSSVVHSKLRKTLMSRAKAMKFYDDVYEQIEAVREYLILLLETATEIQSETLASQIENL